jgi:hypothetical protein
VQGFAMMVIHVWPLFATERLPGGSGFDLDEKVGGPDDTQQLANNMQFTAPISIKHQLRRRTSSNFPRKDITPRWGSGVMPGLLGDLTQSDIVLDSA